MNAPLPHGEMPTLAEVFGIRKEPVLSYLERPDVDGQFAEVIDGDKHVVIYGSSKQGKTALLERHVPEARRTVVHCDPGASAEDIYTSVLRQNGVQLQESTVTRRTAASGITSRVGFKALIPAVFSGSTDLELDASREDGADMSFREVPFNLSSAQSVAEILKEIDFSKLIVLENYHYLGEDVQKDLAYDLRTFQDLGIRFIVLGVWREKNRLVQYNGDLLDRIVEIPVEPWSVEDFSQVAAKGAELLNISFSEQILDRLQRTSYGSIGVFQELLKQTCNAAGITNTQDIFRDVVDIELVTAAIATKVDDYRARHLRALESIAEGRRVRRERGGAVPLFIPYYFVKVLLSQNIETIEQGIRKHELQTLIQQVPHHRPDDVRTGDMTNFLNGLSELQKEKGISPPILDYDHANRRVRIIDSTLFFYLANIDVAEEVAELPNPVESYVPLE